MITLKDTTSLISATSNPSGYREYTIAIYDDCDGSLWLYGHEHGPTMVIRARSFEAAYNIAIDESETIPQSEVYEAYGFYGDSAAKSFSHVIDNDVDLELVEGYRYQSNASGTGIVETGHYEWLREMTREDCASIRLTIRADD